MSDKLDVKGKDIDRIIKWYFANEIWVNRRYQRKLVWSLEDKKSFIDSIINKFPTPSMMLASYDEGNEHKYEIIDGLQRINAIISFATGEFPIQFDGKDRYFDLTESTPIANQLKKHILEAKTPVLSHKICEIFLNYELPLILTEQSPEKIELIFSRINSKGKKLSAQDLRQSCSCDNFADLVRRVSCYPRGEFSFDDLVNLSDMPKISISGTGLNYKIDCNNIFWRRHDIITYDNIKQSRDEELIAQILGELLVSEITNPSYDILNKMYKKGEKYNKIINKEIEKIGINYLEEKMRHIFDIIEMIFNSVDSDFSSWIFNERKSKNKNDCFRIFFIVLYKLYCKGYYIQDYNIFANEIKLLANRTMTTMITVNFVTQEIWNTTYTTVYRFIEPLTHKTIEREISDEEKEIKKRLSKSSIESQMTEYKIGISDFDTGTVKDETIHRIAIALSAMANTKSDEKGYVIIGIANNSTAGKKWQNSYGIKSLICNGHYVTGVNEEAARYFHDVDCYLNSIRKYLTAEPLDIELKEYILSNFREIDFDDKKLILIPSKNLDHVVKYNNIVYIREGNSSIKKDAN